MASLVILLLIVLLLRYLLRKRIGALKLFNNTRKVVNETATDSIHMVVSEAYTALTHIETLDNEAYQPTAVTHLSEQNAAYGDGAHIKTHGNEAYQTTASTILSEQNAAYGDGVGGCSTRHRIY